MDSRDDKQRREYRDLKLEEIVLNMRKNKSKDGKIIQETRWFLLYRRDKDVSNWLVGYIKS